MKAGGGVCVRGGTTVVDVCCFVIVSEGNLPARVKHDCLGLSGGFMRVEHHGGRIHVPSRFLLFSYQVMGI